MALQLGTDCAGSTEHLLAIGQPAEIYRNHVKDLLLWVLALTGYLHSFYFCFCKQWVLELRDATHVLDALLVSFYTSRVAFRKSIDSATYKSSYDAH
jgi:hypothetical protein